MLGKIRMGCLGLLWGIAVIAFFVAAFVYLPFVVWIAIVAWFLGSLYMK